MVRYRVADDDYILYHILIDTVYNITYDHKTNKYIVTSSKTLHVVSNSETYISRASMNRHKIQIHIHSKFKGFGVEVVAMFQRKGGRTGHERGRATHEYEDAPAQISQVRQVLI